MEWCERTLVVAPLSYGLCITQKDFEKELKRLKIPAENRFNINKSPGAVYEFENDDGRVCCIVTISEDTQKLERNQITTLLVHEAVHVFQSIKELLGEHEPSTEFEAYSIQNISHNLLEAYDAMTLKQFKADKKSGKIKTRKFADALSEKDRKKLESFLIPKET